MLKRRKIRELAMQILFLWDTQQDASDESARQLADDLTDDPEARQPAIDLARGAWEHRGTIDPWIERLAPQWPLRRQPAVDRNLLRLAIHELTGTPTPPKVVLDEAIELAKQYSTEQSAAFVNGVLDSVLKEQQKLTAESITESGSQ